MNLKKEIDYFRKALRKNANSKIAEGAKNYLKSPWKFYGGTKTADMRGLVRKWLKDNKELTLDEVIPLVKALWKSEWHEEKTLAVMFLELKSDELTMEHIGLIEKMINEATGWDHLDEIAARSINPLVERNYKKMRNYLLKWIKSDNFWVRRAAILSQIILFRKGNGDFELFEKLVVPQFDEGEDWSKEERFFIRKAIGWALRELSPARPEKVVEFVNRYKSKMSGLTYREATRKLPERYAKRLS